MNGTRSTLGVTDTGADHMADLFTYYAKYNNREARKTMQTPAKKFGANEGAGMMVRPSRGSAIMWPNVDLDNIYKPNAKTYHAAQPLVEGHHKWAANAWIHLRDFRTPHASGNTG